MAYWSTHGSANLAHTSRDPSCPSPRTYEFAHWNGMTSPGSTTALDIYAGGRVWWQHADVQIDATGTLNIFDLTFSGAGVLSAEKSVSWFDPLVG